MYVNPSKASSKRYADPLLLREHRGGHISRISREGLDGSCCWLVIKLCYFPISCRRDSPAMCGPRAFGASLLAAALLLQSLVALVSAQRSTRWQTLSGNSPSVIARGGFSGLLPHSSLAAYQLAQLTSVPSVILWCDVQLTKDRVGICTPELKLENFTNIQQTYPNRSRSYEVNGNLTKGWFPVDFTMKELASVVLIQPIYSRSQLFTGNLYPILTVGDVDSLKPQGLWLNVQHDIFFKQHNLSMRSYVLAISRSVIVNYISSPEVGFLRSIASRFNQKITKLVFRFLGPNDIDPSINQTYDSLSKNLTFIKTFASGVLIPKTYIWPMDETLYLKPHTSIVSDAHKAGLEVYASEFYSDVPLSYNYSYDPLAEYLNFVDNGDFSVDGVLSDFPITPSEAIDCFSHLGKNASKQVNLLVISKNGASGDYPGCTDLAYNSAISDGADVIDCPVQMSKDGIPFCLSSINLLESTNVAQSSFSGLAENIPTIGGNGIFTFNLTWNQIQTLTPAISNPYTAFELYRNPLYGDKGKFLMLSDFLALAKNASSLSGVLISIEHVAYLIEQGQLPIIEKVLDALSKAGYANQTAKNVMIQSPDSSVLMTFKEKSNYERVYKINQTIGDALDSAIENIRTFANSVVIEKSSVFPVNEQFTIRVTDVVRKLQSAKLSVYVEKFSNEFVSQAWDFFSDATVEINSFVTGVNINGVVTDFPQTSVRYRKNICLKMGNNLPPYMSPVQPGGLLQIMAPSDLPPAEAPNPALTESDVAEAPLPSLTARSPSPSPPGETGAPPASRPSGQPKIPTCIFMSHLVAFFTILFLL